MFFNPNRINIHELTIEEPEKKSELRFDPERDITEEDWRNMRQLLEEYRKDDERKSHGSGQEVMYFSGQAMYMKILNPTVVLNLDETAWQVMRQDLERNRIQPDRYGVFPGHGLSDWGLFARQAREMKILDPEIDLNLNENAWQGMRQLLDSRRTDKKWGDFSSLAADIKILDPTLGLNLNPDTLRGVRDQLEIYREADNWWIFSWQAMHMKILDPRIDLNLDETAWQGMRESLKNFRGDWSSFSKQAMLMKILAAEEVKVTDKGLEIKMRKDKPLTSGVPPLPETKQF